MRRFSGTITFLLLITVVAGTLANYAGKSATNITPPTNAPVVESTSWFGPYIQTLFNSMSHPFYVVLTLIVIVCVAMVYKKKRVALFALGLLVFGGIVYLFHPPLTCAESDLACKAEQAQKAAVEQRKVALAAAQQQAALERAQSQGTTLFGSSSNPKCDGKTKLPFRYELFFKEVPEHESCGPVFWMESEHTYEVRFRDGHTMTVNDGPGRTIRMDPYAKEVRAVGEAFNAYIVLYPQERK